MFKFRKIFEDIAEKAAVEIIKEELVELEKENIPPVAIDADNIIGITPSKK